MDELYRLADCAFGFGQRRNSKQSEQAAGRMQFGSFARRRRLVSCHAAKRVMASKAAERAAVRKKARRAIG